MRVMATAGVLAIGLSACASTEAAPPVPTDVEVTMTCRVIAEGGLADCRVIRERPGGYGMAAEALASAEEGRASVQPVGGGSRLSSVGSRIELSMRLPITAEAMARSRRPRTSVSEPRS